MAPEPVIAGTGRSRQSWWVLPNAPKNSRARTLPAHVQIALREMSDLAQALWIVAGRCAWIGLVYLGVALLLARTNLGIEWLLSAYNDVLYLLPIMIACFVSWQTYTAALSLADKNNPPRTANGFYLQFAKQFVPDLLTLITVYAVPLLAIAQPGLGGKASSVMVVFGSLGWGAPRGIIELFQQQEETLGHIAKTKRWILRLLAPAAAYVMALLSVPVIPAVLVVLVLVAATDALMPFENTSSLLVTGQSVFINSLFVYSWWAKSHDPMLGIGGHLGAYASLSFALAGMIGSVTLMVLIWRWFNRPVWWALAIRSVQTGVVIFALYRVAMSSYNEAEIRKLSNDVSAAPQLDTLGTFVHSWLDRQQPRIGPRPVILVAAEGGGIRAAYWTATTLAELNDRIPQFSAHVLALSGVSGGSVGTGIYAGLLRDPPQDKRAMCSDGIHLLSCAKSIAGADLLSAPMYGMLAADPLRAITRHEQWPERSHILDLTLEAAWTEAMGTQTMSLPFNGLWDTVDSKVPLLTPNLTSAENGERIILSPVRGDSTFPAPPAGRGRWLTGAPSRMALSSAALASARFPVISPTALFYDHGQAYRTVDGGYADNSGTATLAEVLEAIVEEARGMNVKIIPLVLVLRNSPVNASRPVEAGGRRAHLIGTIMDPLSTLDNIRDGASVGYKRMIRDRVTALGGVYLDSLSLTQDFALTWSLSSNSRARIDALRSDVIGKAKPCIESVLAGTKDGCT